MMFVTGQVVTEAMSQWGLALWILIPMTLAYNTIAAVAVWRLPGRYWARFALVVSVMVMLSAVATSWLIAMEGPSYLERWAFVRWVAWAIQTSILVLGPQTALYFMVSRAVKPPELATVIARAVGVSVAGLVAYLTLAIAIGAPFSVS